MSTITKIVLVDTLGIVGFALFVMFPDAVGGILFLGVMLGFGYIVLDAVVSQWTWESTAVVATPFIFGALRRAGREKR